MEIKHFQFQYLVLLGFLPQQKIIRKQQDYFKPICFAIITLAADVAQLVEQCFRKAEVVGSTPTIGSFMTRLERHRKKQIAIYAAILVFFLIAFILFGLPFFISSSVFVSNLFGRKSENTPNGIQTIRDLNITDIPEATNSGSFIITGTLNNFDSLDFYLNGEKVKSIDVSNKDSFGEEISGLRAGDNNFYIMAKAKSSTDMKKTSTYTITYKNNKPKLEISTPQDNFKTNQTEIKVAGSTDKDAEIDVNAIPVIVDPNGNWQTQVKLNNGDNKIIIKVRDSVGNQDEKTLTVNYSSDN